MLARLKADTRQVLLVDGGTGKELIQQSVLSNGQIWSTKAIVNSLYYHILKQVLVSFT